MPKNSKRDMTELLTDLLIVEMGLAKVRQQDIRAVVGCRIDRVNRIVRHLKVKAGGREQ
jgi:hypothetical protein